MAYEASRQEEKKLEKERSDRNNANNIRNAADVAIASENPYGVAIGGGIKAADKITGGKSTELLGKAMTRSNKHSPLGKMQQGFSNKLSESGASDMIGKAASLKSAQGGGSPGVGQGISQGATGSAQTSFTEGATKGGVSQGTAQGTFKGKQAVQGEQVSQETSHVKTPNQVKLNTNNSGGEETSSLPSSNGKNQINNISGSSQSEKSNSGNEENSFGRPKAKQNVKGSSSSESDEEDGKIKINGMNILLASFLIKAAIFVLFPLLLLVLVLVTAIAVVTTTFTNFNDALGSSQTSGESTGNINFRARSKIQQDFYDRIETIKKRYQANGKTLDTLKISAVYHVLKNNGANITYDSMTDAAIEEIASSMFDSSGYNESVFKNNLINKIIPKYIPLATASQKEEIANQVFDYIDDYHNLIHEKNDETSGSNKDCVGNGTCEYNIKGYILDGQKSYSHNIQVKNLYVRLMQCGIGNNHDYGGHFGKPLEGEDLVPFEKYILGVTYNALDENAPRDAIKAHMVAARSFILARPVDKGSWRTLKQESDDKWVIQVASCTQDQVYCDPDVGCSGKDAQWSQVYSGQDHNQGFSKGPLDPKSKMRVYATQTQGELLVNEKEYIVYSKYNQNDIDQFITLAKSGLNYKQILLQVYNQGNRKYNASNIYKASCAMDYSSCLSPTGEYSNWKQYTGPWVDTPVGDSGKTIKQIGCLATSISILIAKSGVPTNVSNFNPGTFVEFLNKNGGFASGGNLLWNPVSKAAPTFIFQDKVSVAGLNKKDKLNKIKQIVNQKGVYATAEVKGNTGQHWVAIDSINGDTIKMMDPGSESTDMWVEYNWNNTSNIAYFKVG